MQLRVIFHIGPTKTEKYHSDSSKDAARTAFNSMRDSHYSDLHMMNGAHSALGKQLVGLKKKSIHPFSATASSVPRVVEPFPSYLQFGVTPWTSRLFTAGPYRLLYWKTPTDSSDKPEE